MKRPIVVIGFGGHGRVVSACLIACGHDVVAATDLHPEDHADNRMGIRVLSDEAMLSEFASDQVLLASGVGSVMPVDVASPRCTIVDRFKQIGYRFVGFRHPTSWVAPDADISETAQIHAGAIIQPGTVVGDFAILNTCCSVDHDCVIDDYCHVGPGVTVSGNVRVGRGSHLGTGANLIQGLDLGSHCFVAAGATVVRNISAGEFVRGVPARKFMPR
ncbi:acetyltransferase [Planctomycetes bacterium K23_9]|uniref:Acetyltransferase EpsM n=1 Tax=Stieleria marina TaxID=1930275 RepID=A0A517NYT2_9BACT|nr:Putative acetyltransferase EpsM [Planctomycetes bacterium K23_9]